MSINRKVTRTSTNKKRNYWDEAIEDAKRKIAALRKTIAVFEARKNIGDRWPGEAIGIPPAQESSSLPNKSSRKRGNWAKPTIDP
jgi:hypothetical protein